MSVTTFLSHSGARLLDSPCSFSSGHTLSHYFPSLEHSDPAVFQVFAQMSLFNVASPIQNCCPTFLPPPLFQVPPPLPPFNTLYDLFNSLSPPSMKFTD